MSNEERVPATGGAWRRCAFVVAPLAMLAGLAAMKLVWNADPPWDWGAELSLWVGAHLVYLVGYLAYGLVLAALWTGARAVAPRALVDVVGVVGVVGLIAVLGQMVLDLVIGFRSGQRADMDAVADAVQAVPGVGTAFYGLVPAMQLVVVVVLVVLLALRGRVPAWAAVVYAAGFAGLPTGVPAAMLAGSVAMCVALPACAPGVARAGATPDTVLTARRS